MIKISRVMGRLLIWDCRYIFSIKKQLKIDSVILNTQFFFFTEYSIWLHLIKGELELTAL